MTIIRRRALRALLIGLVICSGLRGLPAAAQGRSHPVAPGPRQAADGSKFVGSWQNPVSWTRGIVRIEVSEQLGELTVRVWGRCHPDNCDWGEKHPETFIAQSTRKVVALRIQYGKDHEGIDRVLLLRLEPGPKLRAETYTTFTDDRPAYWAAYFLVPETHDTNN